MKENKTKEQDVVESIRQGFAESVVVFIDMVDSTKYKVENVKTPEQWIVRVKQFCDIIKEFVEKSNGKVVKYIGEEVMAIFDTKTQINDSLGMIIRISEIERILAEFTGIETRIKIAVDYGPVFLVQYEGHDELDPQGTPIDRCARIGKYSQPSTILSSYEYVVKCALLIYISCRLLLALL